jgi:hypothetical protein
MKISDLRYSDRVKLRYYSYREDFYAVIDDRKWMALQVIAQIPFVIFVILIKQQSI